MGKFKVGDKVIGNDKSIYSVTCKGWIGTVTKVRDDLIWVHGLGSLTEDGFQVKAECFDFYKDPVDQKIVITTDGKTTTAVLYDGKRRIKDAKATCAPSDKFDFGIGSALAVERLMGNPKATLSEKNKFLNVRIYIINTGDSSTFTAGGIYDIKNGKIANTGMPYEGKIKDLDDLKYYLSSDAERGKLKHSADLSHHCCRGVKYQILEPLE